MRKGRGRRVPAEAPACAFSELGGKNFKGLGFLEDWVWAYPKKFCFVASILL